VKFETTPAFDGDYRRLRREHRESFRLVNREKFAADCDAYAEHRERPWPSRLRVKPVRGARGVLEMTWSFASPDGRATFELVTVSGELRCRWRRIGDHSVFTDPGRLAPPVPRSSRQAAHLKMRGLARSARAGAKCAGWPRCAT
jgi:hypothetical protein